MRSSSYLLIIQMQQGNIDSHSEWFTGSKTRKWTLAKLTKHAIFCCRKNDDNVLFEEKVLITWETSPPTLPEGRASLGTDLPGYSRIIEEKNPRRVRTEQTHANAPYIPHL